MLWAAAKPIQSALEKPIFIVGGFWISNGWLDNCNFIWREDALTKCIFRIPLLEVVTVIKCHTEDKVHGIGPKNWCKPL
jgi:hypothetical protein